MTARPTVSERKPASISLPEPPAYDPRKSLPREVQVDPMLLRTQRWASGGKSDDPTEDGEPVRDRISFRVTHGRS